MSSEPYDAYEVLSDDATLMQGDILLALPIPHLEHLTHPVPQDSHPDLVFKKRHVIVLSQSCDLEHSKISDVMCTHLRIYTEACEDGPASIRDKKFRKNLVDGVQPYAHLLPPTEETEGISLEWSFADFHGLFLLSKDYLTSFAVAQPLRLRLRSPYREHFSQAFARYMMRVGLPMPFSDFIDYSPGASAKAS